MSFLDTLTRSIFPKKATSAGKASGNKLDLRRTRRVPQRMRSGYVWTDKLIAPRTCIVKDLSVGGARVEILGDLLKASHLIDGFVLYLDTEKHEIPCSLAWMKGTMLGLKFDGRPRPPSRKYPAR
jgi:hypothetical protein